MRYGEGTIDQSSVMSVTNINVVMWPLSDDFEMRLKFMLVHVDSQYNLVKRMLMISDTIYIATTVTQEILLLERICLRKVEQVHCSTWQTSCGALTVNSHYSEHECE